MAFRDSILANIVLIVVALPLAIALLAVGVLELVHPHVSEAYLVTNTVVCLVLCGLCSVLAWVAFRVCRALYRNRRRPVGEKQT